MEVLIVVCSAIVSVATAVYGYFKLVRDNEIAVVKSHVELWKDRVLVLEAERDSLHEELRGMRQSIDELVSRCEQCEASRERLLADKLSLLEEVRELRRQAEE
jgi:chromosome segregation ATPase